MLKKSGKGIFKKTKKSAPAKSTNDGSEKQLEKISGKVTEEVPIQEGENHTQAVVSTKYKKIQLKVTKQGVMIKGVSTPDSPYTKKQKALEVVHRLKKFKPFLVDTQMMNVTLEPNYDSEGTEDALHGSFHVSPRKDTPVKSIFEETSNSDVNANISNVNANINSCEQTITSLPEKTIVTPPKVLHSKSNMEEDETLNINENLSNKDVNVNMGYGSSITAIDTTVVPPPPPHTSPP